MKATQSTDLNTESMSHHPIESHHIITLSSQAISHELEDRITLVGYHEGSERH